MNNISNLIASKTAATAKAASADKERFMLVLTQDTREQLRQIAERLGEGQIKFASELFTAALSQAAEQLAAMDKAEAEAKAKAEAEAAKK